MLILALTTGFLNIRHFIKEYSSTEKHLSFSLSLFQFISIKDL